MTLSWTEIAVIVGGLYVFLLPMASCAADELFCGPEYRKARIWSTLLWPLTVSLMWGMAAIYFPLSWFRALLYRAGKPLYDRGLLPNWLVRAINWVLWRLPR